MIKKINIALLVGGFGSEREVSINSGENVFTSLDKEKYNVVKYDFRNDFDNFIKDCLSKKFDLIIPILHGTNGEDGRLQGFLDIIGIPYLFSSMLPSAISMNKYKTKLILKNSIDLKLAKDFIIKKEDYFNIDNIALELGLPMVVKPSEGGSSCGVSIVKNKEDLKNIILDTFKYGDEIILEEFIKGREITVPVIENKGKIEALSVVEIIPKISEWFDYKAKYEDDGSLEICPAEIDENITKEVQKLSEDVFKIMGCSDLVRIDFILDKNNVLYFLEINTIPGLTKNSLTPKALKASNINISTFFDNLIENKIK